MQRREGLHGSRAGRVGNTDHAGGAPVDTDEHRGAAAVGELGAALPERTELDLLLLHEPEAADRDAATVDVREGAVPRHALE